MKVQRQITNCRPGNLNPSAALHLVDKLQMFGDRDVISLEDNEFVIIPGEMDADRIHVAPLCMCGDDTTELYPR